MLKYSGGLITKAITRVWIEDGCISCGASEANCPEVFKVKDEGATVIEGVDYSAFRRHSSLDDLTPREFAKRWQIRRVIIADFS